MEKQLSNNVFKDRAMLSKLNWNLVKEKGVAIDGFVESGIISKSKWNLLKKSTTCKLLAFAKEKFFRHYFQSGKQIRQIRNGN